MILRALRDFAEFACAHYVHVLSISFPHNLLTTSQFYWIFATLERSLQRPTTFQAIRAK